MAVSQEFQLGINLIKRFREELEKIASAGSYTEAKPIIESIKHPVFGAMAQIKAGEGPLRKELLESLAVVVSNFREMSDFEATKSAVVEVLNLVEQAERLSAEGARKEGG